MKTKVSAIICAAGKGERAGFDKNKLLTPIFGEPALYCTLKKFDIPEIDEVVITSSERDFNEICALSKPFGFKVVIGGKTRTQSVKAALENVTGDIVLIHDGARPFVSRELILKCIESALIYGSGVCALPATDTTVCAENGCITETLDRSSLFLVQTPQAFTTEAIKRAYGMAGEQTFTDDSAVYGKYIGCPKIVEGERENIKLTYREDFVNLPLPALPAGRSSVGTRVGFGVDTHVFGEGNFVTLAGVKIDCDKKLIAHSDGDVIIHAVMDALLSAAGLKDIGHYFPDTDDSFKGADSAKLLKKVIELVKGEGFTPVNLSVSVQAEKPRLAKHIDKMIENLSALTGIDKSNIAIAAGTCEGLGFVGEGLGITAYAVCLVK